MRKERDIVREKEFHVESGRFLLHDPGEFFIRGTIPPGWELEAALGRTPLELSWEVSTAKGAAEHLYESEHPDARWVNVRVSVPKGPIGGSLKVYGVQGRKKVIWFRAGKNTLEKDRDKPRYFLDEVRRDPGRGYIFIRGWAAAATPVKVRLYDEKKRPIKSRLRRVSRTDVQDVYFECPVEEKCGFALESRRIKGSRVYLVMRDAKGKKAVQAISFTPGAVLASEKTEVLHKVASRVKNQGIRGLLTPQGGQDYRRWLSAHLPDKKELEREKEAVFPRMPLFSVLVCLDHPLNPQVLKMVESVENQTYASWELILATEGKRLPGVNDSRIHQISGKGERSERLNQAVKSARGEYLVFCGEKDLLEPHSLFSLAEVSNLDPRPDFIYSDEDRVSASGHEYLDHYMKPDYNPDLLGSTNYISHLTAVSRKLFDRVGGFRTGFSGAEDYDLILRCTEAASRVYHIPKILYHWRLEPENPQLAEGELRALQEHWDRLNIPARVEKDDYAGLYHTRFTLTREPLVSIIIGNMDHWRDLKRCIDSIEEKSTYKNFEYIIIENNSREERTFAYYEELKAAIPGLRVVTWKEEGPFNYSDINNFGASFARGEFLLFLNNDTRLISPSWLEEMLGFCMRPDVGAVGARLYYEDDTIQHAGTVLGFGGMAGHCFVQQPRENPGYHNRIVAPANYSAVTAACMMVKKAAFDQVGGFCHELAVAFNDVDLCLKLGKAGYRVVYNPHVELYHFESKSRGLEDTPEKKARFTKEVSLLEKRWPQAFSSPDPYYNPNLSLRTQDYSLKEL